MTRWTCPRCDREFGRRMLRDASEVDEQVRGWLTEAFLHASGEAPRR